MTEKPIRLEFVADVAKYLSETKKMSVSTEDVEAALVAATNTSEEMERKLRRAMRDAARDVDVLERAVDGVRTSSDRMGDEAGKAFRRVGDDAADAGAEVAGEFRQNFGEALSSGNLEDIVGDTLGGLVASMSGPWAAPAVAGAALAAFLWNGFQKNEEAKRAAVEGVWEAMDEVTGLIDQRERTDAFLRDYGKDGSITDGLRRVREEAERLGVDMEVFAQMLTGQVTPATQAMREELDREYQVLMERAYASGLAATADRGRVDLLADVIKETDKQRTATDQAREAYETYNTILGDSAPQGPIELSDVLKGIKDDAEGAKSILQEIRDMQFTPKRQQIIFTYAGLGASVYGEQPLTPFQDNP